MGFASSKDDRNDAEVEARFNAVPDGMVAEILDGELIVSPRPAAPHAAAEAVLTN